MAVDPVTPSERRTPMTVKMVKARVAQITALSWDDEAAHSAEDELRDDVLRAIAEGHPDAQQLAAEVVKTSDIAFGRWCA